MPMASRWYQNRVVTSARDAAEPPALLGFPAVVDCARACGQISEYPAVLVLQSAANAAEVPAAHPGSVWHPIAATAPTVMAGLGPGSSTSSVTHRPAMNTSPLVECQASRPARTARACGRRRDLRYHLHRRQGGTPADIVGDIAADLAPEPAAGLPALIACARRDLLGRFRDDPPTHARPPWPRHSSASARLIVDFPRDSGALDPSNPLIVDTDGVLAADAWLRLREPGDTSGGLAISPAQPISSSSGRCVTANT